MCRHCCWRHERKAGVLSPVVLSELAVLGLLAVLVEEKTFVQALIEELRRQVSQLLWSCRTGTSVFALNRHYGDLGREWVPSEVRNYDDGME